MMNANTKARWVEDLRSGKYNQCRGSMTSMAGGYCCIGVLAYKTLGVDEKNLDIGPHDHEEFAAFDDIKYKNAEGGYDIAKLWAHLVNMNDGRAEFEGNEQSFAQIADWIEKNVEAS